MPTQIKIKKSYHQTHVPTQTKLVSLMIIIFFFFFNLSWYFFVIKIWVGMPYQTFLILKKSLAMLVFFIQHLITRTILIQGWKVKDQFDTEAKGWGPKQSIYIYILIKRLKKIQLQFENVDG